MTGNNSGTNVGTYTATYTPDSSHKWSDDTYDAVKVTLTISKADNPISVTATQSGSLTFSTSAQDKTFTAATGGQGSVTYAIQSQKKGSTNVSYFSIPTSSTASFRAAASTPAGTYTIVIRATAAGNDNYNSGYKDITYTLTINKQSLTIPTLTNSSKTYNGSAQSPTVSGYDSNTMTQGGTSSATNAGTYSVSWNLKDTANYIWADNTNTQKSASWTINKATPSLVFNDENISDTFGAVAKTKTINGASGNAGTLSYELTSQKSGSTSVSYFSLSGTTLTIAGNTPAGIYTISVKATDAGNGNYNSTSKTKNITLTINALTVKFNGNGGTGSMDDFGITKADDKLPGVNFYKDGYTFIGWKIE